MLLFDSRTYLCFYLFGDAPQRLGNCCYDKVGFFLFLFFYVEYCFCKWLDNVCFDYQWWPISDEVDYPLIILSF